MAREDQQLSYRQWISAMFSVSVSAITHHLICLGSTHCLRFGSLEASTLAGLGSVHSCRA